MAIQENLCIFNCIISNFPIMCYEYVALIALAKSPCIYWENTSDKRDIPLYTTGECCIKFYFIPCRRKYSGQCDQCDVCVVHDGKLHCKLVPVLSSLVPRIRIWYTDTFFLSTNYFMWALLSLGFALLWVLRLFLVVDKILLVGTFPVYSIWHVNRLLSIFTLLFKYLSLCCKDWCLTSV